MDDLLSLWDGLATPGAPGELEAREVSAESGIWLAVDAARLRHLLVRVPDGSSVVPIATKGLAATVGRHRIRDHADAEYVDVSCLDEGAADVFAAVCLDLVTALAVGADDPTAVIGDVLVQWRWFWGMQPDGLSDRDALGLFAELWFLDQWAGTSTASVSAWTGSEGSRHDFQWADRSVEVKGTARRADGAVVHTVQHLDQLADPESGTLFLFSLRVVRDRLAGNSLPGLVDRCAEQLRDVPATRDEFLRKVASRGYSRGHRRVHETPYRILEENLFEVGDDFPRLTPDSFAGGLPAGVGEVSYTLDMAACAPWLRASKPSGWQLATHPDHPTPTESSDA